MKVNQDETHRVEEGILKVAPELEAFLDIEYSVDVCVGHAKMTVRDILALEQGDRIRLDRLASEHVLLTVEECVIASAKIALTRRGTSVQIAGISG